MSKAPAPGSESSGSTNVSELILPPDTETPNPIARKHQNEALEALDDVQGWSWFTIRTLITNGTGFFTDAYDVFIINNISPMLGFVYYPNNNNKIPKNIEGPLKGMASVGTLVGQLLFGYLGDSLGRKKIYGLELMVIILATICCATSSSSVVGVTAIGYLTFWRFWLGLGIGGDYPMSATITSEWSKAGRRGQMLAIVFSMQGWGNLMASVITLIVLVCFKNLINENVENLDFVWRICVGVGAIPSVCTIYLRLTMPESPRYIIDVEKDLDKANRAVAKATACEKIEGVALDDTSILVDEESAPQRNHARDFKEYFSHWKNLKILLGTSLSWFFLDVAFYGLSLNQSYVLEAIGFSSKPGQSPYESLISNTEGNLIIACLGFVPGYWFSIAFIEKMGRKTIQLMGFTILTILFTVLSAAFYPLKGIMPLFIAIFTLAQFFFNFGPNTTTFVVPGEVFPTHVRATAHGISAASGKLGAIIATFGFSPLVEIGGPDGAHAFLPEVLGIFAAVMFLGLLSTFLVPETMGRSLEDMQRTDADIEADRLQQLEHFPNSDLDENANNVNSININANNNINSSAADTAVDHSTTSF